MSNETVYWIVVSILVYIIANLITLAIYNFFDPIIKHAEKDILKDILPVIIAMSAMIFIPLLLFSLFLHAYDFFSSLSLRQKTHKN